MAHFQNFRKSLLTVTGLLCLGLLTAFQASAGDKAFDSRGINPALRGCDTEGDRHSERWGHMRRQRPHHMQHAFRQLDLTDQQKTAIHEIRIAVKKDMVQKRADMQLAKMELREQMRKESVNMAAVETQVKKIEGLRTAMKLKTIKARVDIKNTLTPEQRKKLAEEMI